MALSSNWQELSVDAAAELLAARVTVVGLRTKQADGPARGMFDQLVPPAGKTLDWLNPLRDPKAVGGPNTPDIAGKPAVDPFWGTARSGVVGAGVGLGLGGLQALMTPGRKRRWLHSLLSGAVLGGGAGLGVGAAMNYGGQAIQPSPTERLQQIRGRLDELAKPGATSGQAAQLAEMTALRDEANAILTGNPDLPRLDSKPGLNQWSAEAKAKARGEGITLADPSAFARKKQDMQDYPVGNIGQVTGLIGGAYGGQALAKGVIDDRHYATLLKNPGEPGKGPPSSKDLVNTMRPSKRMTRGALRTGGGVLGAILGQAGGGLVGQGLDYLGGTGKYSQPTSPLGPKLQRPGY